MTAGERIMPLKELYLSLTAPLEGAHGHTGPGVGSTRVRRQGTAQTGSSSAILGLVMGVGGRGRARNSPGLAGWNKGGILGLSYRVVYMI